MTFLRIFHIGRSASQVKELKEGNELIDLWLSIGESMLFGKLRPQSYYMNMNIKLVKFQKKYNTVDTGHKVAFFSG